MIKRNLVLFDGGSENSVLILDNLFKKWKEGITTFCISGVVSIKFKGQLLAKTEELGLNYFYFQNSDDYQEIANKTNGNIFLFYDWGKEITNFNESTNFKRSNVVCIFPGPWELKGKKIENYKNIHEFLISNKEFTSSAFSVYLYGKDQNDISNLFSFIKVPINNVYDAISLERKVVKAGILKLSSLLDYVGKGKISLNEKGCLNLPEMWVKEHGSVNIK